MSCAAHMQMLRRRRPQQSGPT
ncbi:hypothetical protein CCACVL1_19900 [Corchorus capsularis]|uniref:Uncharacterized protein n=1 Tax=Corchorus capsularis TaxID=210143 RepID=A0A1R3HE14_COCAP|nr:hypothetical protein CCACVL1_19900 [Corchorus capsularis]